MSKPSRHSRALYAAHARAERKSREARKPRGNETVVAAFIAAVAWILITVLGVLS